jgi:DnaK suppressor protein
MDDYTETRNHLVQLATELELRFTKITQNVTHVNQPLSQDFAEQASELQNSEVVDFLGNFTRQELGQIKQAIQRIDQGDYGFCVKCGETISPQRLRVLPFADKCIRCATNDERLK